MSWFRKSPHRSEPERRHPHHPVNDDIKREIEANKLRLEQHRRDTNKEDTNGQFHRR